VRLAGDLTIGGKPTRELFIWPGHWDGAAAALAASLEAARTQAIVMSAKASKPILNGCILDIGYKSQTDNRNNPTGSCNVTSSAMCLTYWGIKGSGQGQFEDELYEWMENEGLSRHEPNHLKIMIEHFGCRDHFTTRASIAEIKKALDSGVPVIVHGYFTTFGHIIVIIGYNDKGFICHDPYGEWTSVRYDLNDSSNPNKGKAILYSYGLIERTCLPDGGCWAHFVTRPGFTPPKSNQTAPTSKATTSAGSPRRFKPQEFRSNSIFVKFVTHFEGLELEQYYCSAGVSTIGIGTTRWFDGGPIPQGAKITREQAIELFNRDTKEFVAAVRQGVDVPLTARQIAALISFAYNNGVGAFLDSTLLKVINRNGTNAEVREQFRRWVKAGDNVIDGLIRRRNAEAMLWEGRDDWETAGYD
jgi:GH24 family phage-related lysozyme (muramidase)/uncharacterized protein YvpB